MVPVRAMVKLMRPVQWMKNGFVLIPVIFSGDLGTPSIVLRAVAAMGCFCLASSAVYVFNDLVDVKADRRHPQKKNRPIAAGQVSTGLAVSASLVLLVVSLIGALSVTTQVGLYICLYVILNVVYTLILKQVSILDVFSIAAGFVLRVLAGAVVTTVSPSRWLLLMTFFLALFLSFGKRRHEIITLDSGAANHRLVLGTYSVKTLDQMLIVLIGMIIATFSLYTVSDYAIQQFGTDMLIYTIPFVVFGLFRYLSLMNDQKQGGNPTELLLTDKPLLATVALWVLTCIGIIYG